MLLNKYDKTNLSQLRPYMSFLSENEEDKIKNPKGKDSQKSKKKKNDNKSKHKNNKNKKK